MLLRNAPRPQPGRETWAPAAAGPRPVRPTSPRPRLGRAGWKRGLVVAALLLGGGAAWLTQVNPFGDRPALHVVVLGADVPQNGRTRSDTLLLTRVRLAPDFGARVVSVYRDTRVQIPGHGRRKINAAMAFGGPALLRRTLEGQFGVQTDREVVVSLTAAERLVDALGGVELDVPVPMHYRDRAGNLEIHIEPGPQRLNGRQAVRFLRWRSDGRGDIGRVERQRMFLAELAKQALRPEALLRWPAMAGVIREAVRTDFSFHELAYLGWRALRSGPQAVELRKAPFRRVPGYVVVQPRDLREALGVEDESRLSRTTAPRGTL